MAKTDPPPMHKDFAPWYGAVSLGNDQARRETRWAGVSRIVRNADRNMVEGLLRLAHQSRQVPAADVVEAVRQAFKATDEAFEMNGNDRELQILAGACLAVLMEANEDVGPVVALIATTAELGGARHPNLSMDLAALGETAIVRLGEANRQRPSLEVYLKEPRKFDFENAATRVNENQSWESIAEAFNLAAGTTYAAMKQLTKFQGKAIEEIDCFLRVQDEELQMLWWLTGQRSWNLDCSFDDIPATFRPLMLASELAHFTEFLPGPPSVKGILSRAGLKEHENVRIADAVNAADSTWLQGLVGEVDPSIVSTPLHAAIKQRLDTGPGEAWVPGWAASTGVNNDYALPSLALGNLFYRERLLLLFE